MDLVKSVNPDQWIETSGFKEADEVGHMIEWLGRGQDFRQFIANDLERELYGQTPGAQLMSMTCAAPLSLETSTSKKGFWSRKAIVTGFSITFPLTLLVRMSDGTNWRLNVNQAYHATNLHLPAAEQRVIQNFTVVGHQKLA